MRQIMVFLSPPWPPLFFFFKLEKLKLERQKILSKVTQLINISLNLNSAFIGFEIYAFYNKVQ